MVAVFSTGGGKRGSGIQDRAAFACGCDAIEAALPSGHLRVMLESGTFLSATGFTIVGSDTAEAEDGDSGTSKKNDGVIVFWLTRKEVTLSPDACFHTEHATAGPGMRTYGT